MPTTDWSAPQLSRLLKNGRFYRLGPVSASFVWQSPHSGFHLAMDLTGASLQWQGFWGPAHEGRALWEALACLSDGKPLKNFQELSWRELEAFCRSRNSVAAFDEEDPHVSHFKSDWQGLREAILGYEQKNNRQECHFPDTLKFAELPLIERIRWVKSYLSSPALDGFKEQGGRVELVDMEGVTLYLRVEMASASEGAFLDWLQDSMARVFRDSAVNIVPEP